jgi:hypothetical protein
VKPIPKELSFDEKLSKIQKYLPSALTESSGQGPRDIQRLWFGRMGEKI